MGWGLLHTAGRVTTSPSLGRVRTLEWQGSLSSWFCNSIPSWSQHCLGHGLSQTVIDSPRPCQVSLPVWSLGLNSYGSSWLCTSHKCIGGSLAKRKAAEPSKFNCRSCRVSPSTLILAHWVCNIFMLNFVGFYFMPSYLLLSCWLSLS